jgi:hypothetical protein
MDVTGRLYAENGFCRFTVSNKEQNRTEPGEDGMQAFYKSYRTELLKKI